MGVTTKGSTPATSFDVAKGNVPANGPPAQQQGPVLGPGDAGFVSAEDYQALVDKYDLAGHPVDLFSGAVVDSAVDLALPGLIPVDLKRVYNSWLPSEHRLLGTGGWTFSLAQYLVEAERGWKLRGEDGRFVPLHLPDAGSASFHRAQRYEVTVPARGSVAILGLSNGLTREFRVHPNSPSGLDPALLCAIRDRHGNAVELEWDGFRLARIHDTANRELVFQYGEAGSVTRVEVRVDGRPLQAVSYEFHPAGELAAAVNALGHADRYEYDTQHRMTKVTLKNGVSFHYQYDPATGQCVKTWGDGGLHQYEFVRERDDQHVIVTTTGTETPQVSVYNLRGNLLEKRSLAGDIHQTREVDEDGLVVSEADGAGNRYRHAYDHRGNRTSTIDPNGNETRWDFEADFPVRRVTADGLQTELRYDSFGCLVGATLPTGLQLSLEYDRRGRLTQVNDSDGAVFRFEYDPRHNLVAEWDRTGARWTYTYDDLGRPLVRTTPIGTQTRIEYDPLNHPVRFTYPDQTTVDLEYEPLGNVSRAIGPSGDECRIEYAGTGVMSRHIKSDGSVWKFHYDAIERLRKVENPRAETYEITYDRSGRIEAEKTFDGRRMLYRYDLAGRIQRIERPDGTWRELTYSPLGHLTTDDSPHGKQTFERDSLGRLLHATVDEGQTVSVTFERDRFGHVLREAQGVHSLLREYDRKGRCTKRVVPACGETHYHYDAGNRLGRLRHTAPSGAVEELRFARDALGRELSRSTSAGAHISQNYDWRNRLLEQKIESPTPKSGDLRTAVSERSWRYDKIGRLLETRDSRWGPSHYSYDRVGNLLSAQRGQFHEVFEYQPTGALERAVDALRPGSSEEGDGRWTLGSGNRLLQTDRHDYEYDLCGRRVAKTERATRHRTTYTWDCRDRLREIALPDGRRARYHYDAFGRRVRKEIFPATEPLGTRSATTELETPGTGQTRTTEFLWDGDQLAAEIDSEAGERGHVHYPSSLVPLLQVERGEIFVVVTNQVATPTDLISNDGSVRWSADHTAWGKIREEFVDQHPARGPPTGSPFRLMGQYWDEESGLAYARYRYFDADSGRWCSPDPLGILGGENHNGFSGAPTTGVDPLGLEVEYGDLDDLGRPTGAAAYVTPVHTGGTTDPGVDPPGFVSGNHPHHHQRGHLIAAQLGGSNDDPRNFVTLTDGTNHPGMSTYENQIRAHVDQGNRVVLTVTPYYDGPNLIPSSVHMYAVDIKTGQVIVDVTIENGLLQAHKSGCC